jgi:hypothetical protein
MCERCIEIDEKIDVYRQLSSWVLDNETRRGIDSLVQKYRVDKRVLHPPREQASRPDTAASAYDRANPTRRSFRCRPKESR